MLLLKLGLFRESLTQTVDGLRNSLRNKSLFMLGFIFKSHYFPLHGGLSSNQPTARAGTEELKLQAGMPNYVRYPYAKAKQSNF